MHSTNNKNMKNPYEDRERIGQFREEKFECQQRHKNMFQEIENSYRIYEHIRAASSSPPHHLVRSQFYLHAVLC